MTEDIGRSPADAGSGYSAEPEPEEVSAVPVSIPNALSEQEHFYLHSILRCLRDLNRRVCEEWQTVSLQSEALSDNIDWLDCFIEPRCPTRGNCDQCWPEEMAT